MKYPHRITIMRPPGPEENQDEAGQPRGGVEVARPWAMVKPRSGNERREAEQTVGDVTHDVELAFRRGITPEMWVLFRGRRLNIVQVINWQERNRMLILQCREKV